MNVGTLLKMTVVLATAHTSIAQSPTWRDDPAWFDGKAEWAQYEAERVIYGQPRQYEATVFTNRQHMDPATTTKHVDHTQPGAIPVFKHTVSESIPTDNYRYRFLTTSFVRADNLWPYKLVMSSQEDCGSTYKQLLFEGGRGGMVRGVSHCYFPGTGESSESWPIPGLPEHLRFHNDLTLALRDFPFDDPDSADVMMKLVPHQTDNRPTPMRWAEAQIHYEGRKTIVVPFGRIATHHLRIAHEKMGGTEESQYWFAADPAMRHVLVQYEGPYEVKWRLRQLAWWAYWNEPRPE